VVTRAQKTGGIKMNRIQQLQATIAECQAELEQLRDGFMPLSELAKELRVGDLIELKVECVDLGDRFPVAAGGQWLMPDLQARKSRSQPEPAWSTVADLLPELKIGDVVQIEGVVDDFDNDDEPLSLRFSRSQRQWIVDKAKARKVKGAGDELMKASEGVRDGSD